MEVISLKGLTVISLKGRTSIICRLREGLVCKIPWSPESEHLLAEFKKAITIEKLILERLGDYCGIIQYHGPCVTEDWKNGLILSEANCGDLQSYIDTKDSEIDDVLRERWSLQIAKAVAYLHENGIIHMNLSTTNVLLHQNGQTINAILADFGACQCTELGLYGDLLPDDPYRDPQFCDPQLTEFTPKVDVFSLGVIIYIIMTGHYPFHKQPAPENDKMYVYGKRVQRLYREGEFPSLSGVSFGDIIAGCCCEHRFETAKEVVSSLEAVIYAKQEEHNGTTKLAVKEACGHVKV